MRRQTRSKLLFSLIILSLLTFSSCSQNQNWPQFRGPDGNMVVASSGLPEKWSNDTNVLWSARLDGPGYSSPVVWGNKVFITTTFPEKVNPAPERGPAPGPPPQAGQGPQPAQPGQGQQQIQGPPPQEIPDTSFKQEIYKWEIRCFDLKTGTELWKQVPYQGAPKAGKNPNSTYACETPVTDGKKVYAFFGMHGLYCYDMDGRLLWKKEFGPYYTQRGWGTGSSPILYNDVLFIQFDNEENSFIMALNAESGDEKWRVQRDEKTTYSTPYIWRNKTRTELVTSGKTARSYDPETGRLFWELKIGGEQAIPSPVGNEELIFIGNPG